jgi:mono/diheme cytochrome c family protein
LNRWVIIILGLMAAAWVNAAQAQGPSGQDLVKRLSCQGCHALAGREGKRGPAWDGVGQRLAPEAIKNQLVSPKGCMPNFAHLRPEELHAVVEYLKGLK